MKRVVIFASGSGSNAQALIEKAKELRSNLEIVGVFSDKKEAYVLQRAKQNNIPAMAIEKTGSKVEHEEKIINILSEWKPDWIFLAGYMRILSAQFIEKYPNRIINIHPSLLPEFPGRTGYEDAFHAGVKSSGVTIHYVDEGIDTGKHIIQESFPRYEEDSLEDFKKRGLQLEHKLYPHILEQVAYGKL